MSGNIYLLDNGPSVLLVDINSLCFCEISKNDFTEENVRRAAAEKLSDPRPYFERLKPEKAEPKEVGFSVVTSFACNYACEYCYQRPSKSIYDRMKPEDVDGIYRFYQYISGSDDIPFGFDIINIMGGEPLLPENRGVLQRVAELWPDTTLQITTNGTYLAEFEEFLLSNKTAIRVSLDGTEQTHYSRRKTNDPEAYRKAIDAIRQLLAKGKEVVIMTVFSPDHVEEYRKFFDELEELGWGEGSLIELGFMPEIGCGNDDYRHEQILRSLEAFSVLREQDPRTRLVDARKLVPGAIPFVNALRKASMGVYNPYRCACLHEPGYAFMPDGAVMPCLEVQDRRFAIGRFKPEFELNEVLVKTLAARRIDTMERCKSCRYRVFCGGGCLATVIDKTKDAAAVWCELWEKTDYLDYLEQVMR